MTKEQVIEKVRKLLTLARHERTGEIEATNAANRARVLLAEYNLDLAIVDQPEPVQMVEDLYHTGNMEKWKQVLLNGVTYSFFCRSLRLVNEGGPNSWAIVGKPHNVAVARETVTYLISAIARLAKGVNRPSLASFKLGCSVRICERLLEKRNHSCLHGAKTRETRLPALLNLYQTELAAVSQYLQSTTDSLKTDRMKLTVGDPKAFKQGLEAGSRVSLDPQIRQTSQPSNQLGGY